MRFIKTIVIALCLVSLVGCKAKVASTEEVSVWADSTMWFQTGDTVSADKIDLFYLVSTDVMTSHDSLGNVVFRAVLNDEERAAIGGEFAYVEKHYSKGDYNFFAPYYHQFNFEAIVLPKDEFAQVYTEVAAEVCEAFDYYMNHLNQGRPFALVGFSQGSMMILDLLKHMSDEQYGQMVGAYMMGYRLSAEDLEHPHIIAAHDEETRGVTVSYNSVMSLDATWPLVSEGAADAINPVNWKTDSTPAQFEFLGDTLTVAMDEASHQLLVSVPDPTFYHEWNSNPAFTMAHVHEDCLHHWDLLYYSDKIRENIKIRNK